MKKNFFEYLLLPFALVYRIIIFVRNKLFDLEIIPSRDFAIPIIAVGNITVGGTGKTPHVEYLIRMFSGQMKIAILSRGYKRKSKGFVLAHENSTPAEIGDEPCQIKSKFPEVIVAVDKNRVMGIKNLKALFPDLDLILLDDAFQHRYVKPGLSILLIDYNRPVTKDFLLPFGRLREPVSAVHRANIVLITKSPEKTKGIDQRIYFKSLSLSPFQHLFFTSVKAQKLNPLFLPEITPEMQKTIDSKPQVLLVTGIANPRTVKKFARTYSTNIIDFTFPDHYNFKERDIENILAEYKNHSSAIILLTEKDAMRFRQFKTLVENIKENIYYIPIAVEFLNNDGENFKKIIKTYVESNKRNSILHKGKDKV